MDRFKTILVALFIATTHVNAVIRPSASQYLIDGEGFLAYLEVAKSFGAIQNCWFKFRENTKVRIDLNSTDPLVTERGEVVLPFASSVCGIRVNKLSAASAAVWTLEVENVYGDFEQDHLTIQILPVPKTNFDTRVQREIGRGTIACTKYETYTKHCQIIDGDTKESWHQCELFTLLGPNKTFECLTYNWGRMEASKEHIVVEIKNSTVSTSASVEEDAKRVLMRCQFGDTLQSCQAEMADHKSEIYIMNGLYSGRYSSYDTLVSKSKCALEIPKPLLANEIGLWRIKNYNSPQSPSGCLFYIGQDMKEIIAKELKSLVEMEVIKIYKPENELDKVISEISCTVPFVIDDCYLRDPNNTVYFPESLQFQRYRMYGRCSFENLPGIAGIWTCGARGRDYEKEVLQNIEVIVKSKGGEVLTENIKAKRGSTVELMCRAPFDEPITNCVFIDPRSGVHLVGTVNSIKAAGHIKYYGRGITRGECGIKISEVTSDDFGQWKCQFVVLSGKLSVAFVMQLTESAIGHATSVGLGIGLTIIAVLVLGVAIGTVFYRRRNLTAQHNFPSTDPIDIASSATLATTQA